MTPEYLEQLADLADPHKLWRRTWVQRQELTPEQRIQLDTGVALRRHASHVRELRHALERRCSVVITPISPNSQAVRTVPSPPDHAELRDGRPGERRYTGD